MCDRNSNVNQYGWDHVLPPPRESAESTGKTRCASCQRVVASGEAVFDDWEYLGFASLCPECAQREREENEDRFFEESHHFTVRSLSKYLR